MSMTIPSARTTAGSRRAVFIPGGVADLDAITLAEMSSGENVSCYLTVFNKTAEQAAIQDRRWCSSEVFEIPGEKTKTLQLTYVTNLHDPSEDRARLALAEGAFGTLVRVLQKDEDESTFEGGDFYDAVNILTGEQNVIEGEDNALDRIIQKEFIRSRWSGIKQLVPLPKTGWTVDVTGTPTGGTFTLSVNGHETAPIAYNATHTNVATAVNALQSITGVTATSAAGPPIALTFSAGVSLSADGGGLTGGSTPDVTVA